MIVTRDEENKSYKINFPQTLQTQNRVLVAITVAYQQRLHFLERQLFHYSHACNQGYEIHVLLISRVSNWEIMPIFNSPGYFRCHKHRRDLPIRIFDQPPIKTHLAFYHRIFFQQLQNQYDYFICQEDDLLITHSNLEYFVKYENKLRNSGMLPTFQLYEIPHKYPISDDIKAKYPNDIGTWPRAWETATYMLKINGHLIKHNDEYYMLPYKTYSASYMIPRWVLEKASKQSAWLDDEHKPWKEFNVHFAHQWLNRYYYLALPISSDFENAFIHHGPNRYINEILSKRSSLGYFNLSASSHGYAVDINEMSDFLTEAFGQVNSLNKLMLHRMKRSNMKVGMTNGLKMYSKQQQQQQQASKTRWDLDIDYITFDGEIYPNQANSYPLKGCVDSNRIARIEPTFHGSFPESFYQRKARVVVKVQCLDKSHIFTQDTAVCKCDVDEAICNNGFGPEAKQPEKRNCTNFVPK